jgi:ParB-like chromosome segregation protein Spo0J
MPEVKGKLEPKGYADGVPVYCAYDEIADVEKCIPNPDNPNTHSERQIKLLAKIIKANGWRLSIVISNRSGFITKGHGRLKAAHLLGVNQVPIDYQDYASEAEEWADIIADNRIAELAERDKGKLKDIFGKLDFPDIEITGYTLDEVDSFFDEIDIDEFFTGEEKASSKKKGKMVKCPSCGEEFAA